MKKVSSNNAEILHSEFDGPDPSLSQTPAQGCSEMRLGKCLVDVRSVQVNCGISAAFKPIQRIGGRSGWYYGNWLWRLRGFIDQLVGGEGLRRGRQDPENLACGDIVDCWQVEAIEPNHLLRLFAQMKLPGRGWLQFEVEERGSISTIRQTALFEPAGLFGLVYWYALYPLHQLIFAGMLREIARIAGTEAE